MPGASVAMTSAGESDYSRNVPGARIGPARTSKNNCHAYVEALWIHCPGKHLRSDSPSW